MAQLQCRVWTAAVLMAAAVGSSPALAGSGDTCAEATEISALPFSSTGSTCGAGNDFTNEVAGTAECPDLPKGYGGDDVFFKLNLEQGNQVAFDLALPPGAKGDLALFLVRAPSCSDPRICAGNSVDLIGAGVGPERIKANAQAYPSGTYYLIIDSKLSAPDPASCGPYALTVSGHLSAFCGNGALDPGEVCDDGNASGNDCCAADCKSKAAAGTVCRPSNSPCDVAETCNANGTCPVNAVQPAGTVCRPAGGLCDVAELCDGVTASCPLDRFFPAGAVCRPAVGVCDQTESCTGAQPSCPTDVFKAAGTACGIATLCQKVPTCNASAVCAPGGPVSCEDNNPCTLDGCHPILGCQHAPICQDAGADASGPDGATDGASDTGTSDMSLAPDVPAPDSKGGPMLVPDGAPAAVDGREGVDSAIDAPPGRDTAPTSRDTAPTSDGTPSPPDTRTDGPMMPPSGAPDANAGDIDASGPRMANDGGAGSASDVDPTTMQGFLPTDAGFKLPGSGQSGCSCQLGAGPGSSSGLLSSLIGLTFIALLALRRRTD
jgi:cysteine-rich repeat protein